MTFKSILFKNLGDIQAEKNLEGEEYFVDLNLEQIIHSVIRGKQEEYNIKPFFYMPLHNIEDIYFRQQVMRDLENTSLFESIKSFAERMHSMRVNLSLADRLHYKYNKQGWFLEAVRDYCEAVSLLIKDLPLIDLKSPGFLDFRAYLDKYIKSDFFISLQAELEIIKNDLSKIMYCLVIKGNRVKVQKYNYEIDYNLEVEKTFEKFKRESVKDYRCKYSKDAGMNHIEANIINCVARLFPEIFLSLDNYCKKNFNFVDDNILKFDREVQFYITYLELILKLKSKGLKFCYPEISDIKKEVYNFEGFDLALADKLFYEKSSIVTNDFYLEGKERILVVSGPNQGGKTTFARTFGQLHYLASLGLPVPGRKSKLFLYDKIFTHFEKEEDIKNLRGKLQDDLLRIQLILDNAFPDSIIILNEIFTSTTLQDSIFLSKKIMEKIIKLNLFCVWVTFIVELSTFGDETVSMVSTVKPENPALRTFKIIRKQADGLAYAISIAEKYRLTQHYIKERIRK